MSEFLRIESLKAGYDGKVAIEDVSLTVKQGSLTVLLGANGAGKSTLMKSIAGLMEPFSGKVLFKSEDMTGRSAQRLVRSGVSYVPEGRAIARALTVKENLLLGGMTQSRRDNREQFDAVIALFPELQERLNAPSWQLSGGQQQMMVIGRALMSRPRLLLLDEPSLGLAPLLVKRVFERLEELRCGGLTILLVEQNYWISMKVADRAYFMRNGRIVGCKDAHELRATSSHDQIISLYLGTTSEASETT
ncbi:ABC transporter ATP-binding protein [Diaphorobacter sp. HDW4A]|uniref:ABC transporter ATP-binding protein n=1 Tax=Diaphorobacter sp. HDW4A TaxID=2714924 RepID=UPI00140A0745|nr:ABC transporter ATP-binding protein [Diaphorobacter sp. HDW4A]QIL79299.1 ABC transporter ATP-binding protein [Diaphorobacter sp. HDW4A]